MNTTSICLIFIKGSTGNLMKKAYYYYYYYIFIHTFLLYKNGKTY